LLAHGRWFSPGTPASSTTKTGRHDIAENIFISHDNQLSCSLFQILTTVVISNAMLLDLSRSYTEKVRSNEGDLNFIRSGENLRLFLQSLVQIG
jgi:hypothetical protein